MRRTVFSLGVALTLLVSPVSVKAHGGCYGFWPFWPLAFGTGIALGTAAYYDSHCYPRYVYASPPCSYYGYSVASPIYAPPAQAPVVNSMPALPAPPPVSDWVPSSPGAGHWVPEPHPYRYVPGKPERRPAAAGTPPLPTISVTSSLGNVPVYTISR